VNGRFHATLFEAALPDRVMYIGSRLSAERVVTLISALDPDWVRSITMPAAARRSAALTSNTFSPRSPPVSSSACEYGFNTTVAPGVWGSCPQARLRSRSASKFEANENGGGPCTAPPLTVKLPATLYEPP